MVKKSRGFCYTSYDGPIKHEDAIYQCYGNETCPTTGRAHAQGYMYFSTPRYIKPLLKKFPGVHIEPAKGSPQENIKYCSKEGDFHQEGDIPKQGKRSDIEYTRDILIETGRVREVVSQVPSYQAVKYAETICKYIEPSRKWKPNVYWYYGDTGVGKSKLADEQFPDAYWKPPGKWWDGYDGHEDVIIDDFRLEEYSLEYLLRLLDRYSMRVEFKGGSRSFLAKNIVITCPYHPHQLYHKEDYQQLRRRIDEVRQLVLP